MNSQRLLELDALRGIAALAVVLFHYFYRYNDIYGHKNIAVNWSLVGEFGVELFFMVSGFVIFWTLNRIDKPFDFIVSRFSRLYPAYWCALLITFSLVSFFGLPGREVSSFQALMNGLMFQEYFFIPHVDGVYWTLTVELTFYFWMFILYLRSGLDKAESIFSFFIVLSVLHSLGILEVPYFIYKILILKHLPFFVSGICLYKIFNSNRSSRITIGVLFLSLFSTIAIYSFGYFLIFLIFHITFYLVLTGRMAFLAFRPLLFMGSISYSLYLLHQNIGYIIINKFYELSWNPLIGILVSLITSIALAALITTFIEIRCLKFIRNAYKNSRRIQGFAGKFTFLSNR